MTPQTVAYQAPLSMGILQARILEWVTIFFSRGSSWSRDRTQVSHIAGRFFTVWATRETWWNTKYSQIAKKLWSFLYMMWPLLKSPSTLLLVPYALVMLASSLFHKTWWIPSLRLCFPGKSLTIVVLFFLQSTRGGGCSLVAKLCLTLLRPHGL